MGAAHGEEPPPELQLYWRCQRFSALPDSGGMLDQDERLINVMVSLDNIYSAVNRYLNLTGDRIHLLTELERRVLRMLKDMEVMFVNR